MLKVLRAYFYLLFQKYYSTTTITAIPMLMFKAFFRKDSYMLLVYSASKMTYIVSSGALNSTHSLTQCFLLALVKTALSFDLRIQLNAMRYSSNCQRKS